MSNPGNADTQDSAGTKSTDKPESFASQVDVVVQGMKQDDKGTWLLPEGEHSEEVKYAAMSEKRRRDTQSAYVKSTQELAHTKSERDAFKGKLAETVTLNITEEQAAELEELKHNDPDAWKDKLTAYETAAQTEFDTSLEEVSTTAKGQSEVARRKATLAAFEEANPGFSLDDDDIPPRISKKLESGEISFEDFLGEVHTYIQTPKKVSTAATEQDEQPNLSKMAGGGKPSDNAVKGDIEQSYATTDIF